MVRRVCRYNSHRVFCILFETRYCHRVDSLILCVSFDLRSLSIPKSTGDRKINVMQAGHAPGYIHECLEIGFFAVTRF